MSGTADPGGGITALLQRDRVAGERICAQTPLRLFYARRKDVPAWREERVAALLRALDALRDEGLDPARYHRDALMRLPAGAARDVLASDAFLLAATHLSSGAVDPQFVRPSWCPPPAAFDVAALLQSALDDDTIAATFSRIAPQHDEYVRLRAALAAYRAIDAAGGWPVVSPGPRADALRARLTREGYDDA